MCLGVEGLVMGLPRPGQMPTVRSASEVGVAVQLEGSWDLASIPSPPSTQIVGPEGPLRAPVSQIVGPWEARE